MRLFTLGTGAPLAPKRATTGLLFEADGCAPLLVDTCGGFEVARRLAALGRPPEAHRHAVLTHRHGDHIGGVPALAMLSDTLHLYGPEDALEAALDLVRITFGDAGLDLLSRVRLHPLEPERPREIAGFTVETFEVVHRVPTHAVRVSHGGRTVAFSADTIPCDALVRCARGADLFVCDALCASTDGSSRAAEARALMHPTAAEAAEVAERAGARALALVHVARYGDPAAMWDEAIARFSGPVTVPDDNQRLDP